MLQSLFVPRTNNEEWGTNIVVESRSWSVFRIFYSATSFCRKKLIEKDLSKNSLIVVFFTAVVPQNQIRHRLAPVDPTYETGEPSPQQEI